MTDRRYTSTTHVAAALGVSATTVKRWVDEGVLPAQRTAGGHRRILVADVLRVAHEGDFPCLDVSRLGLSRRHGQPYEPGELARLLLAALKEGNGSKARLLIQVAYRSGSAVADLADAVIAPVMTQIGHDWQTGSLDVLYEHRASQICAAALYTLKAELEQRTKAGSPVAVGGGPEGDPYLLANLLAEMVLLDAGWAVVNLGPNTPLVSFRKAIIEFRPRLLWLSFGHPECAESFAREYKKLYEYAVQSGTAIAVGGRALTEDVRANLPYTTHGDRMSHLSAFARSLHHKTGRPRPPRYRKV
jgi:MerR family transcriptional regulator, light-induced transcriptional regulator